MHRLMMIFLLASTALLGGCEKEEPIASVTGTYEVVNVFPRQALRVDLRNVDTGEILREVYVRPYRSSCSLGSAVKGAKKPLVVVTYRRESGQEFKRIDNSRPFCEGKWL